MRFSRVPGTGSLLEVGLYTRIGSGLLHRVDFGGQGPWITLIHGLGGSTSNWDAVAPSLCRHGRVVGIDLPGFGLSPPGKDYRVETHREAVEGFLETLGTTATLVGNSTGGLLAEMVASHRPDLVDRLILVAPATPPVLPDPRLDWPTALRLLFQATPGLGTLWGRRFMTSHSPEELVRLSLAMITHDPERVPIEVVEASNDMARIRVDLPWAVAATARTATSIAGVYAHRSAYIRMIRRIVAPTLVIQGVEDHIVSPTAVARVCRRRPDWDLVHLADTGHTPQMDAPGRFLDVVQPWLESKIPGPAIAHGGAPSKGRATRADVG